LKPRKRSLASRDDSGPVTNTCDGGDRIQERAYQVVPHINGGQWRQYTAVRTTVSRLGGDDGAGILGGGEGGLAA